MCCDALSSHREDFARPCWLTKMLRVASRIGTARYATPAEHHGGVDLLI